MLRPVRPEDISVFYEFEHEPGSAEMAAFPPRDRAVFEPHWEKVIADPSLHKMTVLVDGEVAGHVVSYPLGDEHYVGYWVGRRFWGRGVATAALTGLVAEVSWRPLYAFVAKHNPASIRVLEKCGFVPESEHQLIAEGIVELRMVLAG